MHSARSLASATDGGAPQPVAAPTLLPRRSRGNLRARILPTRSGRPVACPPARSPRGRAPCSTCPKRSENASLTAARCPSTRSASSSTVTRPRQMDPRRQRLAKVTASAGLDNSPGAESPDPPHPWPRGADARGAGLPRRAGAPRRGARGLPVPRDDALRRRVREELGASPSQETQALYRALRG